MSVRLLTEHHLEFLSLTGGCTGLSESTLVKMPHCWKSMSWLIYQSRPRTVGRRGLTKIMALFESRDSHAIEFTLSLVCLSVCQSVCLSVSLSA